MSNFWTILWDTYLQKIKTKSFIIIMVLIVLAGGLAANYSNLKKALKDTDEPKIAILTNSKFDKSDQQQFISVSKGLGYNIDFDQISNFNKGKLKLENGELNGILVLKNEKDQQLNATIYESKHINESTLNQLNDMLITYNMHIKANHLNLKENELQYITQNQLVKEKLVDKEDNNNENSSLSIIVIYVLVFLLYGSVMIYSNMIAQDIASEKSSRVMEIIMSSTKPIYHMFGKVIGVGLVGITQIMIFLLTIEVFSLMNKENFLQSFIESGIEANLLMIATICFLVGYLLYSLLAAVIGSLVSTIQEVQQLYLPIMFLLFFSFFVSIYVTLSDHVASWVKIVSYIPFFSPVIMFARYGIHSASVTEILISLLINIVFIIILSVISTKLYRGGVFVYESGKITKLLKRSLEVSNNESK